MAEGNGVDLGSIYGLLREVAATVSRQGGQLERIEARHERHESVLQQLAKDVSAIKVDVVELRQTVANYHASVLGHGIMISELEDRVRRIERHLELPPFVHG